MISIDPPKIATDLGYLNFDPFKNPVLEDCISTSYKVRLWLEIFFFPVFFGPNLQNDEDLWIFVFFSFFKK